MKGCINTSLILKSFTFELMLQLTMYRFKKVQSFINVNKLLFVEIVKFIFHEHVKWCSANESLLCYAVHIPFTENYAQHSEIIQKLVFGGWLLLYGNIETKNPCYPLGPSHSRFRVISQWWWYEAFHLWEKKKNQLFRNKVNLLWICNSNWNFVSQKCNGITIIHPDKVI